MKAHYLKKQNMDSYYKVFLNEILYDTEQGKTYRAIKKCSDMLQEMKEKNENHYDIVYSALGNIYDMRGNYRMANKYYKDALKACAPNDTGALAGIYSRIASLQAHREPQKAMEVNEHFGSMTDFRLILMEQGFDLGNRVIFMKPMIAQCEYQREDQQNSSNDHPALLPPAEPVGFFMKPICKQKPSQNKISFRHFGASSLCNPGCGSVCFTLLAGNAENRPPCSSCIP